MIQEAAGTGGSSSLPTPVNATGTIAMSGTSGKVLLASTTTPATGTDGASLGTNRIDVISYGTSSTPIEGNPTANLSNTNAARRLQNGCQDTDANSADFEIVPASQPGNPRNANSPLNPCGGSSPVSTNPAGSGTASPNSVLPGATTLLTVNVTPGTNPSSSGINVTADLSSIGGATNQTFVDNGNNTFSFQATVTGNTPAGSKTLPVTITDSENRTGKTSINLNIEQTSASVDHVVISQIYGGGGNSGATYTNDYVELYNPSTTSFNLTGWSLQYASATGSGWGSGTQPLGGTIAPGEYYLVSLASGGAVGQPLPVAANITGGEINLSGSAGKIALIRNGEALSGDCPLNDLDIVDFVGYGTTATCSEGDTKAPAAASSKAIFRKSGGSTDTNVNGSDFTVQDAFPRRTAIIAEIGPSVLSTDPRSTGVNVPRDASVTVSFTEPVNVDPSWFNIICANNIQHNDATIAVSSNFKSYVITPNTSFVPGEQCSVKINKDAIHDQDTDDSAPNTDTLSADYSWSFTVAMGAAPPYPSGVHLTMGNPSDAIANINEPNNFLMEKDAFALSYNRDRGTANWVSWHLDQSWTGNLQRNDTFRPDPAVPSDWYRVQPMDYFGSGFDRGHMTPNADRDNANSIPLNQETFLMTNMIPQAPDNNQGPWANMENDLRALFTDASGIEQELYIIAGGAGTGGTGSNGSITTTFADGRVTVPAYTWKVALVLPKGDEDLSRVSVATKTIAVIMPNKQGIRNNDWKNYLTTVDAVESLTGYDFFSNVSDDVENSIEAGINGANSPVAKSQSVTGAEDTPKAITLSAMSANSNTLTYTIVSQPTNGVLTGEGANIIYTPNTDFNGVDSFTFRASDGQFASNVSTVTINVKEVNDAPAAAADNKTTDEDTALNFAANELVQNDSAGATNEGGQILTVTSVIATDNTHGQVSLNGGNITYNPSENFSGQAVFDYNVCDNGTTDGAADSKCSVGTVTITVTSVNDAPVLATIGNKTVNEDTPLNFTATATDIDAPSNNLNFSLVGSPNGASIDSSTGAFTWTPAEPGIYTFTVKVTDDGNPALSDQEEITVTVLDKTPPTINNAPSNQTLEATGADGAVATWNAPTATDTVDGSVAVNCLPASGSTFAIGSTIVTCTATDKSGNTAAHTFTITVRDSTAPSINIASPTAANYLLGQIVPASYSCTDIATGVASCIGTVANGTAINTTTTGTKTFSVTATDNAGNTGTKTVTYTVSFGVVVLFDQTKQHNSGSTIPIKLQIVDAAGTNQSAANNAVTAVRIMPGNLPVQSAGNSQPGNLFLYEDGAYQFNLKTSRDMAAGTYQLVFRIAGDPVEHSVQFVIR